MPRNIEAIPEVTNVVPSEQVDYAGAVEKAGDQIITQEQDAKINNNLSQAQVAVRGAENQFRNQYQTDPFNEQGLAQLQQTKDQIYKQYGDDISTFFQNKYQQGAIALDKSNNKLNENWQFKQAAMNTKGFLANSIQTDLKSANQDGEDFANGLLTMPEVLAKYSNSKDRLQNFADTHMGGDPERVLDKYTTDTMKSFLAGVADKDPQKAAQLMSSPEIQSSYTPEEKTNFIDLIAKTEKAQQLQKTMTQTINSSAVQDIINDPKASFYDKRLQIDQGLMDGTINTKVGAQALRVLTAKNAVDTATNAPDMSDIVEKMYDLNAQTNLKPSEYLDGVQSIHAQILQKQADGLLNDVDVEKLNNEMKTLTSKKTADFTQEVGRNFKAANDLFKTQLPPEARGEATRQLFYQSQGQTLTPDQQKAKALSIIDNINQGNRQKAYQTLKNPENFNPAKTSSNLITQDVSDEEVLQKSGYTAADVAETAKETGKSEAEVIKALRKHKGY